MAYSGFETDKDLEQGMEFYRATYLGKRRRLEGMTRSGMRLDDYVLSTQPEPGILHFETWSATLRLRYSHAGDLQAFNRNGGHGDLWLDIVESGTGSYSEQEMDVIVLGRALRSAESARHIIMLIESRDGISYRRGLGYIPVRVFEGADPVRKAVRLG